jgi:hypothetical protein
VSDESLVELREVPDQQLSARDPTPFHRTLNSLAEHLSERHKELKAALRPERLRESDRRLSVDDFLVDELLNTCESLGGPRADVSIKKVVERVDVTAKQRMRSSEPDARQRRTGQRCC